MSIEKKEIDKAFLIDDFTSRTQEFITYFKNFPSKLESIKEEDVLKELIKDLEKIKKEAEGYLVILNGLRN